MKGLQNNYNTLENYVITKENYWQNKINDELDIKYKKYNTTLKERYTEKYTEKFGSFSIGAALKTPIKYPPEFLEGVS